MRRCVFVYVCTLVEFLFFLHPDACGMFARFCYFAAIFNEICGSVSVSEDVCSCKDATVVVVVAELPAYIVSC